MSNSNDKGVLPSEEALEAFAALQRAVDKAIDRKRRLGQYWVVADADGKPVKVYPENSVDSAAE
ncbi:MAG: hypothetical protein JF615_12865 [Asticcacaulis sp.]|nr:hypothetical protein [Asticcacaulis sp.]